MKLGAETIAELASQVAGAEAGRSPIPKLTDRFPDLSLSDAYSVQDELRRRATESGRRLVGFKMGLTSRAKMLQMGVDQPVFGFVTDAGACPDGGAIRCDELIHPRVEPEIVFVMARSLSGPGCHVADALAATDFVTAGIEVIDSRYEAFRFDLPSVIADNTSAARFVLGSRCVDARETDLVTAGVVLELNGCVVEVAAAASVLGHPAASVAQLANLLAERGEEIPPGAIVLTGGATAAVAVSPGDHVAARIQGIGSVSARFE
jgi:2-oxo-3-hexenedioate decarboxylase